MEMSAVTASATQSETPRAFSQLTQNFDTFLTLLTTQLRNQNPLEPLNTEKFTEQLVQFASVEQSIQTNQNLEALIALQSASSNETALAMVGRIASVNSDTATLTAEPARWTYTLPADAANVSVNVVDANGATVAVLAGASAAGAHEINWTGGTDNGGQAPEGAYRLVVNAVDANGDAIEAVISTRGRVDAVVFRNGAAEIEIAGQRFSLEQVSRIDIDI